MSVDVAFTFSAFAPVTQECVTALFASLRNKTCFAVALLLIGVSCTSGNQRSTEERIAAEVADKLAGWQARRDLTCRTAALEIAVLQADSMILEYARENKLQLERPSRPIRPVSPELQRPNDTLKLEPFLGDTL